MNVLIEKSTARGSIAAPPSKSEGHRALICAALSGGESTAEPISVCDDVLATAYCLRSLGAEITLRGSCAEITGKVKHTEKALFCGESGSTLRFFLPVLLIFGGGTLCGTKRLISRPTAEFEKFCRGNGFDFEKNEDGISVRGTLIPGEYEISCGETSQHVSGLMMALGSLRGESVLHITGDAVSTPYISLTAAVMKKFGAHVEISGDGAITVGGGYTPSRVSIGGDSSSAAALAALGDVSVIGADSVCDGIYPELFSKIKHGACEIDVSQTPDLFPVLAALGAKNHGVTLCGTARLSGKESDRVSAMADELSKFGVETIVGRDTFTVLPSGLRPPAEVISSHGDHRIAMACAVLCADVSGILSGAECVGKSYPTYWDDISSLGIRLRKENQP